MGSASSAVKLSILLVLLGLPLLYMATDHETVFENTATFITEPIQTHEPPPPSTARTPASLKRNPVRIRWSTVPGAVAYQVKSWQTLNGKDVVLVDAQVKSTEARVEPCCEGQIFWQIRGIDASGNFGESVSR